MVITYVYFANDDGKITSERKLRGFFSDCSLFKVSYTGNRAETISSMHRLIKKPSVWGEKGMLRSIPN